ncbi:MAG TPA: hypothetical protein VL125_09650 [Pelobium sp.]|nr:hypothetical protein [Pelobium sp.]
MQNLLFKKEHRQGIFSYLNTLQPPVTISLPLAGSGLILRSATFQNYIALAEYLMSDLKKYVVIRYSPSLLKLPIVKTIENVRWKYELLSDDHVGLGIDKGFLNTKEVNSLCVVYSLLPLTGLPEDTFGDAVSWISIFGLKNGRETALKKFMCSDSQPNLFHFLQKEEIFIHITIGKEEGLYHSMLIKSAEEIEESISAFQTVINPNN